MGPLFKPGAGSGESQIGDIGRGIRTEKLPSAAMAQLPFGGTPSALCAESIAYMS